MTLCRRVGAVLCECFVAVYARRPHQAWRSSRRRRPKEEVTPSLRTPGPLLGFEHVEAFFVAEGSWGLLPSAAFDRSPTGFAPQRVSPLAGRCGALRSAHYAHASRPIGMVTDDARRTHSGDRLPHPQDRDRLPATSRKPTRTGSSPNARFTTPRRPSGPARHYFVTVTNRIVGLGISTR